MKIYFGNGEEENVNEIIIFSHGRGATPFMYSLLLMNFATKRKVVAIQHQEKVFV